MQLKVQEGYVEFATSNGNLLAQFICKINSRATYFSFTNFISLLGKGFLQSLQPSLSFEVSHHRLPHPLKGIEIFPIIWNQSSKLCILQ